jgi:hypothetical protein
MAKYRGKYEGKLRGKYVRAAFISVQNSEKDNIKFYRRLNEFLYNRGYETGLIEGAPERTNAFYFKTNSYHLGGATVGIKLINYSPTAILYGNAPYATKMRVISNDSLDDVLEKILKDFPSFEKRDLNMSYE